MGDFTQCKLTGANFIASLGLSFSETLLNSAFYPGLCLLECAPESGFFDSDLSDTDFRKAELVDCGLARISSQNARVPTCLVQLSGFVSMMPKLLFKGAVISKAQASILLSGVGACPLPKVLIDEISNNVHLPDAEIELTAEQCPSCRWAERQ